MKEKTNTSMAAGSTGTLTKDLKKQYIRITTKTSPRYGLMKASFKKTAMKTSIKKINSAKAK